MKTILALFVKDLRRDAKHPWTILLFASLPILMTSLMAAVFGGSSGKTALPAIHVAILDQDQDLLAGILRSFPSQGEAAQQLRLHFVDRREDGVRLLEKRQASALVVFPKNMTENLLNGLTNTIELYENPAEQVLPKVVRQGISLLAAGLSGAAEILREPLTQIRGLVKAGEFPAEAVVGAVASGSVERLGHLRTYLFPPLIQFTTVKAADYQLILTNAPANRPPP